MWAYARATMKEALLSPVTWGLLLVGVFFGWFATTLAILNIVEMKAESLELVVSTSQLFSALLAIGLVGRLIDEDQTSGFTLASDACAQGPGGRLLGRWLGATAIGSAASLIIAGLISLARASPMPDLIHLLSTSIMIVSLVAAWAVLLGSQWNGAAAGLITILLWMLGHFPWGRAPFLGGDAAWAGNTLRAWLPGPRQVDDWAMGVGYTSAAVAGLLLLTLAFARPAEPRG